MSGGYNEVAYDDGDQYKVCEAMRGGARAVVFTRCSNFVVWGCSTGRLERGRQGVWGFVFFSSSMSQHWPIVDSAMAWEP
jgi:hypothetical protein